MTAALNIFQQIIEQSPLLSLRLQYVLGDSDKLVTEIADETFSFFYKCRNITELINCVIYVKLNRSFK